MSLYDEQVDKYGDICGACGQTESECRNAACSRHKGMPKKYRRFSPRRMVLTDGDREYAYKRIRSQQELDRLTAPDGYRWETC